MTEQNEQSKVSAASGQIPAQMSAIVQDRYGNPDVLSFRQVPTPIPGPEQVLIRVEAASLNMFDVHMTTGYPLLARLGAGFSAPKNPVPGSDIAGTIVATGSDVTSFSVGDQVFGLIGSGSFADFALAGTRSITHLPDGVGITDAAATPLAGITALQALRDVGGLAAGQRVVINGATGGVGTFAVQIGKTLGAEVAAVCSTGKVELVRALGADHVVDYRTDDYTERLRNYDLLFDNVGNRPWSTTKRVLRPGGRQVTITGPKHRIAGPFRLLVFRKVAARFGNRDFTWFTAAANRGDLDTLGDLLSSGTVKPVVEQTYPMATVPDGLRYLSQGHALGKLVVTNQLIP